MWRIVSFFLLFLSCYGRFRSFCCFKQPIALHLDSPACSKPDDLKISVPLYNLYFPDYPIVLNNVCCWTSFKFHVTIASYTEVRKGKDNQPVSFLVRHHPNVAIGILCEHLFYLSIGIAIFVQSNQLPWYAVPTWESLYLSHPNLLIPFSQFL